MAEPHFLIVTFPSQGHINPSLRFAERLLRHGVNVTFATAVSAITRMKKGHLPPGLSLATYSDGFDQGFTLDDSEVDHYMSEVKRHGSRTLKDYITSQGPKFSRVIYTLLLPWVSEVARDFNIPSTLLWIQPAALFDIYYYHFNGYEDAIRNVFKDKDPSSSVKLPGLPPLKSRDLPSFVDPSNIYGFALPLIEEHIKTLAQETNPKVLVNTFDALELDALRALDGRINQVAVGPLVPPEILDADKNNKDSFRGDLFETSKDYVEWLNSKPESSVVYVSFGSLLVLSRQQEREIANGLLESGRPFLWVVKKSKDSGSRVDEENDGDESSCREGSGFRVQLEKVGRIVEWCSQVEVLSHPAVGCFVTHCGWNSSSESLAAGVPVVAFPRWTDQTTNAKLMEDVWGMGVRVAENGEGVVEGGEISKCVEVVMGDKGEEMRRNAMKWKDLAREAVEGGGSSDVNLAAFVEEVPPRI